MQLFARRELFESFPEHQTLDQLKRIYIHAN